MKTRVLPVPGGFVGPEVSKVVGTEGCMVGNFVGHRVGDNATNKDLWKLFGETLAHIMITFGMVNTDENEDRMNNYVS